MPQRTWVCVSGTMRVFLFLWGHVSVQTLAVETVGRTFPDFEGQLEVVEFGGASGSKVRTKGTSGVLQTSQKPVHCPISSHFNPSLGALRFHIVFVFFVFKLVHQLIPKWSHPSTSPFRPFFSSLSSNTNSHQCQEKKKQKKLDTWNYPRVNNCRSIYKRTAMPFVSADIMWCRARIHTRTRTVSVMAGVDSKVGDSPGFPYAVTSQQICKFPPGFDVYFVGN